MNARNSIPQHRLDRYAQLLSEGYTQTESARLMGLTMGEGASIMRRIRRELGTQAA